MLLRVALCDAGRLQCFAVVLFDFQLDDVLTMNRCSCVGATGHVGTNTVAEFLEHGWKVGQLLVMIGC